MNASALPRATAHRLGAALPTVLGLGLGLALLAATSAPVAAQTGGDAVSAAAGHHEGLRAPRLRSGPRLPLGRLPRTDFAAVLARPAESTAQPLALGLLHFYRTVVSPVNGSNSDLAPVHSLYAVQAIHAYGALLGSVLTAERLLHESSVVPLAPRYREGGRVFGYDPLAWNVYWLPAWLREP